MRQPSHPSVYDEIGAGYANYRVPDARIAAQLRAGLGASRTICNVGAGTGSYEPADREMTAVEPSSAMIAQRRAGARIVRGVAEALPFRERAFDAALAVLTVHHWQDPGAGLRELRRVAPRRVVFTFDPELQDTLWLVRDYFPEIVRFERVRHPSVTWMAAELGADEVLPVSIPWDCSDGFQAAYWRRPDAYLDPRIRASISTFAQHSAEAVQPGIERLERDLASGAWHQRYGELLDRDEMDFGYRLIVSRA